MSILRRVLVPLVPLLVVACNGAQLPKGEIPVDFLLSYRFERIEPAPAGSTPDKPQVWRITVGAGGLVDYEVQFGEPQPAVKKDEFTIDADKLQRIYDAVAGDWMYELNGEYLGDNRGAGRETFSVAGNNSPKEILVEATTVEALVDLRKVLYDELDVAKILTRPPMSSGRIVMDYRNGVFYPADCPAARQIPAQHRREFPDPWKALDAGGIPSQEYDPFEGYK